MTDARHPDRWLTDRRFLRLSDGAYRLYGMALLWSVANRSDGVIFDDDLALLPAVDALFALELGDAGLWRREPGMWVIEDYATTQTSRSDLEVLENERRRQREKMRRYRTAGKPGGEPGVETAPAESSSSGHGTGYAQPVPGTVPGTVTVTPLGKARTGVFEELKPSYAGTSARGPAPCDVPAAEILATMPELRPDRAAQEVAKLRRILSERATPDPAGP